MRIMLPLLIFVSIYQIANAQTGAVKDERISPFSIQAGSYENTIVSVFKNLPLVTNEKIIREKAGGSKDIIKGYINKRFADNISVGLLYKYKNIQIAGDIEITVHGPLKSNKTDMYIWIAQGKASFITYNDRTNKRQYGTFTYITHFDNSWKIDYLFFNNDINTSNEALLSMAEVISEPIRQKKAKELHDIAIEKTQWENNKRKIEGKLIGYKHGKVQIQIDGKAIRTLDVMRFSIDDQILIKGYIDHLGIPVREEQPTKRR